VLAVGVGLAPATSAADAAAAPAGPAVSVVSAARVSGRCLAVVHDPAGPTTVVLAACDGSAGQRFTLTGGHVRFGDRCLQTVGQVDQVTADGTPVELGPCTGSRDQDWSVDGGALVGAASGKCVSAPAADGAATLVIEPCDGSPGQTWTRAAVGGAPARSHPWLPASAVALAAALVAVLLAAPGGVGRRDLTKRRRQPRAGRPAGPLALPAGPDDGDAGTGGPASGTWAPEPVPETPEPAAAGVAAAMDSSQQRGYLLVGGDARRAEQVRQASGANLADELMALSAHGDAPRPAKSYAGRIVLPGPAPAPDSLPPPDSPAD
jgi:hypothetical protein